MKSNHLEPRRLLSIAGLSLIALMKAGDARAQFTQEELRALPRICHAQKFINSSLDSPIVPEAERKMWAEKLGTPFEAFHHFCWALIYMRRANDPSQSAFRKSNYQNAVGNFEYVQRNSTASFPLLPEVYLRKGIALRFLGEEASAASQFLAAVKLRSDYTPAYAALVDLYVDLKDMEAARAVLEQGLKQVPTSTILSKKKVELESRE
jgi:tetratricopeptide (TPR) repeat protein